MEKKFAIIDIQFIIDQSYNFIKELAIYDLDKKKTKVYLFLPPYPKQYLSEKNLKQNTFHKYFIHGFEWEAGNLPFNQIKNILNNYSNYCIFVKGVQKEVVLKKYGLKNIVNIDINITSLLNNCESTHFCKAHQNIPSLNRKCALKNVYFIQNKLLEFLLLQYWKTKKEHNGE